jgi:hypothetical protein
VDISVYTSPPGGGESNPSPFAVAEPNPVPELTALSPATVPAGGAGGSQFFLELSGRGFIESSTALWNGEPVTTSFLADSSLRATVPTREIRDGGIAAISVRNPEPGGGTSATLDLVVENPRPVISVLDPSAIATTENGYTLIIEGAGFVPSSEVRWNGSPRPTTWIGTSRLTAAIPAADLSRPGQATVTVFNPPPAGGESETRTVALYLRVPIQANDLVYDPVRDRIYASVPSTGGAAGNSVAAIDPNSGEVLFTVFVGSEPSPLAISDDASVLYVGLDGANAVRRVDLETNEAGLQFDVGTDRWGDPLLAEDMVVLAGSPGTVAVSTRLPNLSPRHGGVYVYDDGVRRPDGTQGSTGSNRIEPSAAQDVLYGYNNETTEFGFRRLRVISTGIVEEEVQRGLISGFGIDIRFDAGRVLAGDGAVLDPGSMTRLGSFDAFGPVTSNVSIGRAFFLDRPSGPGARRDEIKVFSVADYLLQGVIRVPDLNVDSDRPIRVPPDGIAFRASDAEVVILRHSLLGAP